MKSHTLRKRVLTLVALATIMQLAVVPIHAQTKYRGTVIRLSGQAEPYFDVTVDPGNSYSGKFIIQHEYEDENKEVHLYIDATDFTTDPVSGETVYPENSYSLTGPYALAEWFDFSRDEVTLNKYGQEEEVSFTVNVPANATPGTRYANIIVSNAPEEIIVGRKQLETDSSGAGIASRIVVGTMLLTVGGERAQSVTIEDITITAGDGETGLFGSILNMHPIRISTRVKNQGNQGLLAGGDLFIHSGDNLNHIYTTLFNPERDRVLPGTERTFDLYWNESFAYWQKDGTLAFDTSNILKINWGRYFAEINILYKGVDGNLKVVKKTVEFWVLPWKALGLLLLILAAYIGYRIHKRSTTVTFVSTGEAKYKQEKSMKKGVLGRVRGKKKK